MPAQEFIITENAINQIKSLLIAELPEAKFRVKVLGGGCSGFKYDYSFDTKFEAGDKFFADGLVVIDKISMTLLINSTLDHYEDLGSTQFIIKNPNTSAKCGCGNSFAI